MPTCKTDLKDCWEQVVPSLKETIGEQGQSTWFSRLFYDSEEEDVLVLGASTKMVMDYVLKHYFDLISKAVSEAAGSKIQLRIVLRRRPPATGGKGEAPATAAASAAPAAASAQGRKDPRIQKQDGIRPARDGARGDGGGESRGESKGEARPRAIGMLNPAYTFESYVPGDNSLFAYNACKAISENPGGSYNPCLIYGGVGLGKTHLLQAIGNHLMARTNLRIQYVTSENFINEFVNSVNSRTMQSFKSKYRRVHVLLIDDIQFLENKKETQAELFNTFNDLYDTGRQIVFSCDRPVSELKDISDRLRNRFERGLSVDIQPPEYETRLAILRHKCVEQNFAVGDAILSYVAQNVQTNVRDLEACLTKLVAYSKLIDKEITIDVAKELLKNSLKINIDKSTNSVATIIKAVADFFDLSPYDIKGKSKKKSISNARQIAMYLSRTETDYSTTEIGLEFGGRDHTTIMYAIEKIRSRLSVPNNEIQPLINQILTVLKAGAKQ